MARGAGMQDVELVEGVDDRASTPPSGVPSRRRWPWVVGVAAAVVLVAVGVQLVADARERSAVARLAGVPGVLVPVDGSLPVLWRSTGIGTLWSATAVGGALVGATVHADGSQVLAAYDLATGAQRWATELYGADPARATAEAQHGASGPTCVPTTSALEPAQIACLVSDGFAGYGPEGSTSIKATATFVRVVDTSDGRVAAQWPAPEGSLVVLDDVAVIASYAADGDPSVVLGGHDLRTGALSWTARVAVPPVDASLGVDPSQVTAYPPNVQRVGDDVEVFATDGSTLLFGADGTRLHAELGAGADGQGSGGYLVEPGSDRLVFGTRVGSLGYSTFTVLADDRPAFAVSGDLLVPAVDDGSVPGLLVVAVPDAVRGGGDGSIILSGVDADTGEVRWNAHAVVQSDAPGVLILRGRVIVSTATGLAAVDGRTGTVVWSTAAPKGMQFAAPQTDGRHLLATVRRPSEAREGALVALDPTTGEQVWRTPLPDGVDYLYPAGGVLLGVNAGSDGNVAEVVRFG